MKATLASLTNWRESGGKTAVVKEEKRFKMTEEPSAGEEESIYLWLFSLVASSLASVLRKSYACK